MLEKIDQVMEILHDRFIIPDGKILSHRRIHKGCREEVLWHFITGRFWDANSSAESVGDGIKEYNVK